MAPTFEKRGIQVLNVTAEHKYTLEEADLEKLLLNEKIKDLPVVLVSVAGAYRGGKSFILNFFIRYLTAPESARQDGSWVGDNAEPLNGFSWRGGSKRNTMGALLWSEPYILPLANGQKVAVLLMDTQGTFDNTSTVRDNSTIFAFSTLLSSTQIYNLRSNIQEDDLQHLQLFTAYGKLLQDQGSRAFQVLEFLVRDWPNPFEQPYGLEGGESVLEERLAIYPEMPKEMQDLRLHIRSCFDKVSCFLMPHPGLKVQNRLFQGAMKDIEPEFREALKELTSSLFGPDKLLPKTINGQQIKTRDLLYYFKTYVTLFNSDKIPTPSSIMQATAEAGWLTAVSEARAIYESGMEAECGAAQPSVPAVDVAALHRKYKEAARLAFVTKKKMGSETEAQKYINKLLQDLETQLSQYTLSNMSKIQTVITEAREEYDKTVSSISKGGPLCVHPQDLEKVHQRAVDAAIEKFKRGRKYISNQQDEERSKFIANLAQQYQRLRSMNEQSNTMAVIEQRTTYWQTMELKCSVDPPLSDKELTEAHNQAVAIALQKFKECRNQPSAYKEDVYEFRLLQAITDNLDKLRIINKNKNKAAFKLALGVYNEYLRNVTGDLKKQCMHPQQLLLEHENGKCRALLDFRPRKTCSVGFETTDEDENTLLQLINERYKEINDINASSNNIAVEEAVDLYRNKMSDSLRFRWWHVFTLGIAYGVVRGRKDTYHQESKKEAEELFYSKRKPGQYSGTDQYYDNLTERINSAYNDA